jgi:hypothetical protein
VQERGGYYLRLSGPPDVAGSTDPARSRRALPRPRGVARVRPVPLVLLLAVGGLLAWAASTPGGIGARIDDVVADVRGAVQEASTDPGLRRATDFYNERFADAGEYPVYSDADLREMDGVDWGVGTSVEHCGRRAVVLRSLTGSGTLSRLLLDGETYGEAKGRVGCPVDLAHPEPFEPIED